jgi:two-component system, LytTR family, sensor kinase
MPSRRALLRWGLPFAFWSIPAALLTVIYVVEHRIGFGKAFLQGGVVWYYWALATPFVLMVARRYPLESLRTIKGFFVHLGAALATGGLYGLVYAVHSIALDTVPPTVTSLQHFVVMSVIFCMIFGGVFYTTIVSIGFALEYQERLRQREVAASQMEARLVEAQLNTLRMQIQPHFLFNTLNTIAMYVRDGDRATSVRLLTRLSELLRHLLDAGHAQEVPLQVELEQLRRYLEIEGSRFSDRLRVTVDVPTELQDAFVPNLVLQPLIENAIRHGVAAHAAAGAVQLTARRENGRLSLTLRNEGPPLPSGWSVSQASGIGLRNTVLRLQHLYGAQAELKIDNCDGGVCVEVQLPYRTTPVVNGA